MESPQGEGTSMPKLNKVVSQQATPLKLGELQKLFEVTLISQGVSPEKAARIAATLSSEQIIANTLSLEEIEESPHTLKEFQLPVFIAAIEAGSVFADALAIAQGLTDTQAFVFSAAIKIGYEFTEALALAQSLTDTQALVFTVAIEINEIGGAGYEFTAALAAAQSLTDTEALVFAGAFVAENISLEEALFVSRNLSLQKALIYQQARSSMSHAEALKLVSALSDDEALKVYYYQFNSATPAGAAHQYDSAAIVTSVATLYLGPVPIAQQEEASAPIEATAASADGYDADEEESSDQYLAEGDGGNSSSITASSNSFVTTCVGVNLHSGNI